MTQPADQHKHSQFLKHARMYIFRGILASIPIFLSYLMIQFIYVLVGKQIVEWIGTFIDLNIPGIWFLLILIVIIFYLVLFYFIGLMASNVVGRQFFNLAEAVSDRIPIVKTIYQVGKQISETLSAPERQAFKKAVLIEAFRSGVWTVGFVTGAFTDAATSQKMLKVFVPTVPNPTSGFLMIANEFEVKDPGWSVDEAIKIIISGGIIGPDQIGSTINKKD